MWLAWLRTVDPSSADFNLAGALTAACVTLILCTQISVYVKHYLFLTMPPG